MADPSILLVAQVSADGLALRDRLASLGFTCRLVNEEQAGRIPADSCPDLILVMEAEVRLLSPGDLPARSPGSTPSFVPLVLFGGPAHGRGREADETIPAGATDALLASRLRVWTRWGAAGRRLRELEARGVAAPALDALTGLPGYDAFTSQLDLEVKRFDRYATPVGLVLTDISGLRGVNERYGHRTGDRVLRQVGESLRGAVRQVDMVVRYSGDTFAVLLPQAGAEATVRAAARLRSLITSLIIRGDAAEGSATPLVKVGIHIGHASLPDETIRGRGGLLAAAEAALERERKAQTPPKIPA